MIELDDEARARVLAALERMEARKPILDRLEAESRRLAEEGRILRRARDIMRANAERRARR